MDGRGWAAGLRKMETGTKAAGDRIRRQLTGMIGGVFAVGYLASATRRVVEHADAIDKTAKRISASTETVQKFDFAATQSGANLESVQDAFMDLAKAIQEAKDGAETKRKALLDFGVTMQMLRTARPEEVFLKIAEAIEKAGGAMDKAKSLEELMGGGGRKLVPAFVSGFSGLMNQAPKGIDTETIESLVRFSDELDRLKREALPLAADAIAVLADIFHNARTTTDGELSFANKSAVGAAAILSPAVFNLVMNDPTAQKRMGVDIDWSAVNERHGKALEHIQKASADWLSGSNPFLRGPAASSAKGSNWVKDAVGDPAAADTAAAAAAKAWSKPSLQLNSLQRIGAAVTQSADPIAIEKSNNKLLTNIARNTKKLADETDDF